MSKIGKRGEVWTIELNGKRRPVVIVSNDKLLFIEVVKKVAKWSAANLRVGSSFQLCNRKSLFLNSCENCLPLKKKNTISECKDYSFEATAFTAVAGIFTPSTFLMLIRQLFENTLFRKK
ncbi:hypothetical protein [Radiobacillus sp. PE A8.2]|uniref:hypothetical protein n=1 Tax=Radiobacillus sp. PE A8.2 TaxID=3380349 RepID=UPI00388D3E9A